MTRTGTVTYGCFPLSSAWDVNNANINFSINSLLKCTVGRPIDLKTTSTVVLDGAIVDNSVATAMRREFDSTGGSNNDVLASEYVSFAIIDRPFTDVTTGNPINYQINLQAEANYGFYPLVTDAFSQSLMVDEERSIENIPHASGQWIDGAGRRNVVYGRRGREQYQSY